MEYHWYEDYWDIPRRSPKGHVTGSGYYITGRLLKYKQPYIHTDQTAFLRTELFDMGYRIFLHYANGAVMEIKLGDNPQPVGPLTASSDLQSILFPDGHLKHPVICRQRQMCIRDRSYVKQQTGVGRLYSMPKFKHLS